MLGDSIGIAIYWTAVTPPRTSGYKDYFSYLLRGLTIERPNQVWVCGRHTYIPISTISLSKLAGTFARVALFVLTGGGDNVALLQHFDDF